MAGPRLLIAALLLGLIAGPGGANSALGQPCEKGDAAEKHDKPDKPEKGGKRQAQKSPEFENVRKAIDALTPEQRKRFQENFLRWANLPPERKKALRDRDEFRRKKMAEDIEAAISESGLQLEKERRAQFAKRYVEERRKIEEELRRELDEKRRAQVKEIVGRLKTEFSATGAAPTGAGAGNAVTQ